jgi:ribonuclease Z
MRPLLVLIVLSVLSTTTFVRLDAQSTRPAPDAGTIRVTLVGTGAGPTIDPRRAGPSTLIEAGSERLLFDAGRGATSQLDRAGVPFGGVSTVFLTHLHSDHVVDLPDLFLSPWGAGQRRAAFELIGPAGTSAMATGLLTAFDFDLRIRRDAQNETGARMVTRELDEGSVWERNGVKVTAFLVDHGPVKPALGYRVEYARRAVALSGDTRYSPNLIEHAFGVDLLIHEISDPDAPQLLRLTPEQRARVVALHTTAEEAARVFQQVKPKVAVYSHAAGDPESLVARTRKTYDGIVYAGEDLMIFEIGDRVEVRRAGQK